MRKLIILLLFAQLNVQAQEILKTRMSSPKYFFLRKTFIPALMEGGSLPLERIQ